jgi:hypothetical protein
MSGKIKRRSLRCGGRPKADFGSLFTSVIAPALSAAGSIADSSIDNNKTITNSIVNNNTTIPSDPTKTPTMRLGGRKKCWIGAAIGAATSIAGSLFGNSAQKREMRRQQSIRDWQNTTQEAANMTSVLNNSRDYQEDYLRQFRTAARLGKTLGAKSIYITDGGDATKIGNNTYLLRGGSHEDVNETGQTGIGINVGGNEVEAEGGEVAQKKNGALRIFSAQPILGNGMSPAQAILRGYNKDKVFNAQQAFKRKNGLKDDGGKARHGTTVPYKRIHINEDGTFTDTLNNKNYTTSATNGLYRLRPSNLRKHIFENIFPIGYDKPIPRIKEAFRPSDKIENFEASSLLPGAKPFKIAYDIPWTNEVFPNNEMVKGFNMIDNLPTEAYIYKLKNPLLDYKYRLGGRCKLRNGGLTSKDKGSSKHPYPSVSSKNFAGGSRSYPIPTKADAVDALRLAGLHGRSDVRSKVYSKYPSLRPKALGGMYVPFNKRYTSIYDAPDYDSDYNGGNILGNGEVTVTAKRIKPTFMKPNNDAMNIINHSANETPYIPQRHNRSRTIFTGGDYLGLGIDTLAALSTGLVNYNTAGKYTLPDRAPIIQASKLPTTYNVNPEIEEVKRYRDRLTGQTFNNTSSSVAALNRSGAINLDALFNLSKLWATKENEENKMLTEDAKNQQIVAAQNVQNELARQSEIARIKNEATQAKGDALNIGLSGLSQAWTNFWTAGRTAYEDDQSRRAMIASSKDATPTRLSEMDFDLSPDILASLYRTAKDDRTKRFYLSRLSPKQRQKYGIN